MRITPSQYAQALLEAVSDTNPKDHDKVLDNFVMVLKQNGDLGKFDEIEKEYNSLRLKQQGIAEAEVTFARDIEMNNQIIKELNEAVGAGLGRQQKTEFIRKVDDNLIGGMVIRVDDTLLDASVRTQLNNLNKALKN